MSTSRIPPHAERMGLPEELVFATKGELAVQILTDACADGMMTDFVCGMRSMAAAPRCAATSKNTPRYVLRVAKTFPLALGGSTAHLRRCRHHVSAAQRRWMLASAGSGSKGERDYAWAWIALASPSTGR